MKSYIPGFILLWQALMTSQVTSAQVIMPVPYSVDMKVSYVRTWDAIIPVYVIDTLKAKPVSEARQVTQYMDGMGRTIQTVARQASPSKKDIVVPAVYDAFGRQSISFLPFVSTVLQSGDLSDDGGIKLNAFQQDSAYNKLRYPGENYFYGQVIYESSPLNRAQKIFAPGNSWMGTKGNATERMVEQRYLVNTVGDSVRKWGIGFTAGNLPVSDAVYGNGQLLKNIIIDEEGHTTIEYTNLSKQVILRKKQRANSPGTGHAGWLCTYSVYDDMGNLRFVIPPKAVEAMMSSWVLGQTAADGLCFRYEYDARHRLAVSKGPGTGEVLTVYDARDRAVMVQDANLRAKNQWMVMTYDSQNRMITTGLLNDANNANYHQSLAAASTSYPSTASNYTLYKQLYYDDYTWVAGSGSGLSTSLDATNVNATNGFITSINSAPLYAQSVWQSNQTKGMATGSKTLVVGSSAQYLYSVSFYDDFQRVIQVQVTNVTGGKDIVTSQYDFSGKVLRNLVLHQKNGTNAQTHTLITKLEYDHAGRTKKIWKNVDNAPADQLITSLQYDESGQVQKKYLGNNLDSLAYDYNIRGWLTGINKNYLSGSSNNYFGMELAYENSASAAGSTSFTNPRFNGSISGTLWKAKGDTVKRKYDFIYDNINQLSSASFVQNTTGTTWDKSLVDFSVDNVSYDANGNILTMNQRGFRLAGSALIDSLVYTYQANSNKLLSVNDLVNNTTSKLGDFHFAGTKSGDDYMYDDNGNLKYDQNRAINNALYNYLNQVEQLFVAGKGNIKYVYDANGIKLQKITTDSLQLPAKIVTTNYMGAFVYQNDTLQTVQHEEGRIRWAFHKYLNGTTGYKYEYDFMESDHLGNVRSVLTQQADTTHYLATMEAASRIVENNLFFNVASTSYAKSLVSGYPADATTTPNDSIARLNGDGPRKGSGLLLKVMSGDKVDLAVKAFYKSGGTAGSPSNVIEDVLSSLATGLSGMAGGAKGSLAELHNAGSPLFGALESFLSGNNPGTVGKPKAYLNWMLLDEQFNYVSSYPQSGAMQIGDPDVLNTLAYSGIPITKNGYLYVWVSNETSGWNVFFDNLSVRQITGPLLEETQYYPFGLAMAGISSKALKTNYWENKHRFNAGTELQSGEFIDGSGLELYETPLRSYDAQIGRFHQVDMLAANTPALSPYAYCGNNPISYNDPSGAIAHSEVEMGEPGMGAAPSGMEALSFTMDMFGQYGGSWSATDGIYKYNSDAEVFDAGLHALDLNDSWGSYGFARNLQSAKQSYYRNGGTDPNVRNADHIIVIGRRNGQWWQTSSVDYSGVKGLSGARVRAAGQAGFDWSWGLDMALGAAETNLGNIIKNRYVISSPWYEAPVLQAPVTIKTVIGSTIDVSRSTLSKISTGLKVGGVVLGAVGMYGTYTEIRDGKKNLIGEGGLDLIMGGVGFIPGGGWIVSGLYFGGKALLEYTGNDFWNH